MSQQELETRVLALEQEVAEIKERLEHAHGADGNGDWIARTTGQLRDYPEWEEVCRIAAELRRADRVQEDDAGAN